MNSAVHRKITLEREELGSLSARSEPRCCPETAAGPPSRWTPQRAVSDIGAAREQGVDISRSRFRARLVDPHGLGSCPRLAP